MICAGILTLFGDQPAGLQPMMTDMLLTLLQPVGFGVAFWRLDHGMDRFPEQATRLTAAQMQSVFVLSLAWGLWEVDPSSFGSLPWKEWFTDPKLVFCIVFAGLGTDLMAIFLVNLSHDTLTSLESFLLLSTEQVWAVVFATIFLGEGIGWGAISCATLIMAGCVLVSEDISFLHSYKYIIR
jgi:drug/metabolite transporter (DMT)-like permease